jgi:hypothetical protein
MGVSGQRHAPAALYPRGKDPRYPLYRRWVGPRAGLDTEDRGKILCPLRGSNPDRPVVQLVVRHYTAWATPASGETEKKHESPVKIAGLRVEIWTRGLPNTKYVC